MRAAAGLLAAMTLAGSVAAACSLLPGPPPTPAPPVVVAPVPSPGPTDTALMRLDPETVLRSVPGGAACRPGTLVGSHGDYHLLRSFVCPRVGDDRTVYFTFADAWESALVGTGGAAGSGGGEWGGPTDPLANDWVLDGETRTGTSRVLGVNGPGTLTLFVSLDLTAR
jgi:hypothetical protein